MDIYWIQDKKRRGPATVPDILSMVQTGDLSPDTRGWHAGCSGWMPLRELPALKDFLQKETTPEQTQEETAPTLPEPPPPPPSIPLPENTPLQELPVERVYLPSLWQRLIARLVDNGIYSALLLGGCFLFNVPYSEYLLPTGLLFWVPMVILEAFLLSRLNTTPGKALMGISLQSFTPGRKLTFGRAFTRSFYVLILGAGMYVPLFALFTCAFSYFFIRRKGLSLWDARALTLPVQKKPFAPSRAIAAIAAILILGQVSAQCMLPWMPNMVRSIEEQSPEAGRYLRDMLPEGSLPSERRQEETPQPLQ